MPARSNGAYTNNTNNSLFKFAIATVSFFAGALVGAYAPDLVLKPAAASSRSGSTAGQEPGAAPLCVGPECAALPPPKLPTNVVPLRPPSPYHASRLAAVRASAASSASIASLEQYSLLLHFLYLHSPASSPLYADVSESLPSLLSHLSSRSFTVSPATSLSLSSLRTSLSSNRLVLVAVQLGGEVRWLAVVAIDAFYVYIVSPYNPDAICYVGTREFVRQWWNVDADGKRVVGAGMVVEPPKGAKRDGSSGKAALLQLRLEAAAEEHPIVEVASL